MQQLLWSNKMSTSKTFEIHKNLKYIIKVQARGYYDNQAVYSFDTNTPVQNIQMRPYDGFNSEYTNLTMNPSQLYCYAKNLPDNTSGLPSTEILMPYNDGKIYHDVKYEEVNKYFVNNGCSISDENVLSGFNTLNYAQIIKPFPTDLTSLKIVFKIKPADFSHHNCIFARSDANNKSIIIRSTTQKVSYYTGSWLDGTTALSANTDYWVAVELTDGTYKCYLLEDNGNYTLSTLPEFISWTLEWTSTTDIFKDTVFNIGFNKNSTGEFFSGSIDLNNCKIWVNGEEWWYFNKKDTNISNLTGAFYNYTDTGAATALNCFYNNGQYLLTADNNIENYQYLGTINIPEHDLYTYNETSNDVYDNFTIKGTLTLNQNTGQITGFSASNYIDTEYYFTPTPNTPWKIRVRFQFTTTGLTQYILCADTYQHGPMIGVNASNKLACNLSNGSRLYEFIDDDVLTAGLNYIVEMAYDGDKNYTLRKQPENGQWNTIGTFETEEHIVSTTTMRIGTNTSGSYFRGGVDFSETYIQIGETIDWKPATTHYSGTWAKL